MTLSQAVQEFLVAGRADGLQESTIKWYKYLLKTFTTFFNNRELDGLETNEIRRFIIHVRSNYAEHTAHDYIRVQHRFWRWCSLEYGLKNPMRNIAFPQMPKQFNPKAVDMADFDKLFASFGLEYADRRNKAMVAFLLDTGARASGVCNLLVTNLNMEEYTAVVTEKGRKMRKLVFTDYTAKIVQAWLDVRHPARTVFYNLKTMRALTANGLQQMLRRAAKKSGIKGRVNPHAFRHAFAREYLRNGGDLATLQRLMGHANVSTTAAFYALFTRGELQSMHEEFSPLRGRLHEEFTPSQDDMDEEG